MNKSVLLSIRPRYCELICNGKKTIEVRKTRPKLETPFKCYIYCTHDKEHTLFKDWIDPPFVTKEYNIMNGKGIKNVFHDNRPWGNANGKVIGEFVCDNIDLFDSDFDEWARGCAPSGSQIDSMGWNRFLTLIRESARLSDVELNEYFPESVKAYLWHISALQIYDKPKELSEFYHYLPDKILYNGDYDCRGGGEIVCMDMPEGGSDCEECPYGGRVYLKRPPESWRYVEELEEPCKTKN